MNNLASFPSSVKTSNCTSLDKAESCNFCIFEFCDSEFSCEINFGCEITTA